VLDVTDYNDFAAMRVLKALSSFEDAKDLFAEHRKVCAYVQPLIVSVWTRGETMLIRESPHSVRWTSMAVLVLTAFELVDLRIAEYARECLMQCGATGRDHACK
jgi:hypothetical protein